MRPLRTYCEAVFRFYGSNTNIIMQHGWRYNKYARVGEGECWAGGGGKKINIACNKFSKAQAISQQIVNSKFHG